MSGIFFVIILALNYLHRLQFIVSEVFILITLITTFLYSSIHFSYECKFFINFLSVKNYLFDHFVYGSLREKSLNNILFQDDFFLKNYSVYQKVENKGIVHVYIVSTFSKTFSQILFHDKIVSVNEINILLHQYPILNNLKFGQVIFLITIQGHGLCSLLWKVSSKESRIYNRVAFSNSFMENVITKFTISDKWRYIAVSGRLNDNFINTARALGLNNNNIQIIIHAMQWQLNFHKLRLGDRFLVLFLCDENSSNYTTNDSELLIIGIRLHSIGKDYYAFRADNGRFYNRDAIGMVRDFIQFPTLKPFRISSNFSLNRLNPITGRVSPHLGVDFAVPIGTPVLSIGDGEVIISKYGQIPGNYIVIRHGSCCITRYMHLNRLLVKPGQIVKKGENIAYSGNTGRSTGPHLHFEVWINHKPVNPLKTRFLGVEQLSANDRINYIHKVNVLLPYLYFD